MVRPKRETGWGGICRSDWVIKYRSSLPDKKQPHEGDNSSSPKVIEPTVGYRSTNGFDSSTHHGVVLCASHASKSHVQMHSGKSVAFNLRVNDCATLILHDGPKPLSRGIPAPPLIQKQIRLDPYAAVFPAKRSGPA
ncbi:hypothetical protein CIHG_08910 [Coccidioides immitis H538.4]|uniref:Uncharacterized protein n=3 Tax=Coccidioides immitis TaxID=5501 RepID=A0A0J8R2J0_COCIT|nr:hypothetical protein CIRG_05270 [Coccidioides immitis RMSCC 2394]KMU77898.1 hypothetical protein CISG_06741 [Coccidioides immitis RMSCC 3703]KMU91161.1 hypothetical protein CIHG_08910 [Coccidioides immitis H538.4]